MTRMHEPPAPAYKADTHTARPERLGGVVILAKIIVEASVVVCPQKSINLWALFHRDLGPVVTSKLAFGLRFGLLAAGLLLVSLPMFRPTPVTRLPVFASVTQAMRVGPGGRVDRSGAAAAAFTRWTIQTEAVVYPLNAKLRGTVDRVFDFEQSWLVRKIARYSGPISSPLTEMSPHIR